MALTGPMARHRIVSLLPSATEIVCAVGGEEGLVGRSHECDFPPSVRALPACTAPKFDRQGTSHEIHERVKAILEQALAVYRVDADRLRELAPDIIITQSQCEACAVSEAELLRVVNDWLGARPEVVSLRPEFLADVLGDIRRVARALGMEARGAELADRLEGRMAAIAGRARSLGSRPSVACVEWIEPLMAAGNWMPELVEMAGGENLFSDAGRHSPWMEWDELRARDPDAIVVLPCGFDMKRTMTEMPALTRRPGWRDLQAVSEGRVFVADGHQYFNRPGPRLAESLEILAEILHPEAFAFGNAGTGWRRYP